LFCANILVLGLVFWFLVWLVEPERRADAGLQLRRAISTRAEEIRLLEKHAIARQLQGFVGLPSGVPIRTKDLWVRARCASPYEPASSANLIFIMERENHIGPTWSGKDLVRTGFTLDIPAHTEERGENSLCFG